MSGGPAVTVHDGPGTCTATYGRTDYPDLPARAFRDRQGRVQFLPGIMNRRFIGTTLDNVARDTNLQEGCRSLLPTEPTSPPGSQTDPSLYNQHDGLDAPYEFSNGDLGVLVHNEFHGWEVPGQCPATPTHGCGMKSTTYAQSTTNGDSYTVNPPNHFVVGLPYQYQSDWGNNGYVAPTNVVYDGQYFYTAFAAVSNNWNPPPQPAGYFRDQQIGTCVMRSEVFDTSSWRMWGDDGDLDTDKDWEVQSLNPYSNNITDPQNHVCSPVGLTTLGRGFVPRSLTYNTYFNSYLLIGKNPQIGAGIYYALSHDLVNWTKPNLLVQDPLDSPDPQCANQPTLEYPAVIDPSDTTDNFERSGRQPNFYFVKWHWTYINGTCTLGGADGDDRDLIKIPIQFRPACTIHATLQTSIPGTGQNLDLVGLEQYLNNKTLVPDDAVVCLAPGNYATDQGDGVLTLNRSNVTIRNEPGQGVAVRGRIVLDGPRGGTEGANNVRLYGLNIDGAPLSGTPNGPAITVTARDDSIERTTLTNEHLGQSCVKASYDSTIGSGPDRLTVDSDRIYDCGGTASPGDQGIEINSGAGHAISNSWIYENSGEGVKLLGNGGPPLQSTKVTNNVIADNCSTTASSTTCAGQTSFGMATYSSAYRSNTIAFPSAPSGDSTPPYNFYISSLTGSSDVLDSNCWWRPAGTDHTWVQLSDGAGHTITNANPVTADPLFTDRTNVIHGFRNYSVPNGNACYGKQPSGTVGGGSPYAN